MVTRRSLLLAAPLGVYAQRRDNIYELPKNLPFPKDDGGCRHLTGMTVPPIMLCTTGNRCVILGESRSPRTVVFAYPRTGEPGKDAPAGWDQIPGARGCTPESCAFRDRHGDFKALRAEVYGLSTQTTEYQQEMAARLHLPFEVLSDASFKFTEALRLPTFEFNGMRLLKRHTLILNVGKIEKVFYPVFPPDRHAEGVLKWMASHPPRMV